LPWSLPSRFAITAVLATLLSPHLYIHDASLLAVALVCVCLIYLEYDLPFSSHWILLAEAAILLGIYSVVLRVASSYVWVVLSVWQMGCVLVAFALSVELKRRTAFAARAVPVP
jgi:hypothetical protein